MAACQSMPAPLKRMSAVAAAFCRLVPPAVAFRMHSAPCHLQAGWVFNILLAVALVVWHVAPLPAGVLVLRAMSTISALMQQIDELLHLAQAEAAAAQQALQELHALRQWAAAQGLQLPAFTGGALYANCMLWVVRLGAAHLARPYGALLEDFMLQLVAQVILCVRLQHSRQSSHRASCKSLTVHLQHN